MTNEYPKVRAEMWWCEDYECDCTQPQITRVTKRPYPSVGYNFERVWEGRFMSRAGEYERTERAERLNEFRKAAHRLGIRLHRDRPFSGWIGERTDG